MVFNKIKRVFPRNWQGFMRFFEVNVLLMILLSSCAGAPKMTNAAKAPEILWSKIESPLFPDNWPPTSATTWIQYTFAYGRDITNLSDGNYVTNPLSQKEWKEGKITTSRELSNNMTRAAVQGVLPMDSKTSQILKNGKQVTAYCLKLTALPDPQFPETKEMLAYYQAWFKYNGAFLDLVREKHSGFIDWVDKNKRIGNPSGPTATIAIHIPVINSLSSLTRTMSCPTMTISFFHRTSKGGDFQHGAI
jgi:hypothetical protein